MPNTSIHSLSWWPSRAHSVNTNAQPTSPLNRSLEIAVAIGRTAGTTVAYARPSAIAVVHAIACALSTTLVASSSNSPCVVHSRASAAATPAGDGSAPDDRLHATPSTAALAAA